MDGRAHTTRSPLGSPVCCPVPRGEKIGINPPWNLNTKNPPNSERPNTKATGPSNMPEPANCQLKNVRLRFYLPISGCLEDSPPEALHCCRGSHGRSRTPRTPGGGVRACGRQNCAFASHCFSAILMNVALQTFPGDPAPVSPAQPQHAKSSSVGGALEHPLWADLWD